MTTVEIKSGYGLTLESEARMLRTARKFGSEPNFPGTAATENRLRAEFPDRPEAASPVTVSTSFLGAHALAPEYAGRADDYIDVVAKEWLPALAGAGLVDAVDAWCEDIAFTAAQCERVFAAAAKLNLRVRLHAEQLSNVGGSQLAARHRALSCDHLEYTTEADAAALAAAGTVAVLLPIAFYTLAEKQLPPIDAFRRERRSARGRVRQQPGLRAGRLAAARDEHGAAIVRADERRGAARHDASRRTRIGPRG